MEKMNATKYNEITSDKVSCIIDWLLTTALLCCTFVEISSLKIWGRTVLTASAIFM